MFSITFHLVPLIFVFIATPLTNPTNQIIINNMNLAFVVLINLFLFKVKPSRNMVLAVVLNFAGALLVLWPLDFTQNPNLAGDITMIVAVVIGAFFPIYNKKLAGTVHPLVLGFSVNAFPALAMMPVLFIPAQLQAIASLDAIGWVYICFIGVGISGIAYVLGNMAYKDPACTPEVYSTWCTLIPVFGMVISLFLYGYTIGVVNLIGAAIVIASIYLAQLGNKPTPAHAL